MINVVLRAISPYLLPALLGAVAATTAWALVQTWRVHSLEADIATERVERATEKLAAEAVARSMAERNASLQAAHAAQQQETLRAYNEALAAHEVAVAAAAADARSLSDAVECYASGRCIGANADPATGGTCQSRTATLGKLFGRADAVAARMAKAADRHADEVRALKAQILADRAACTGGTNGAEEK